MAKTEENLDDVISSLIDVDEDVNEEEHPEKHLSGESSTVSGEPGPIGRDVSMSGDPGSVSGEPVTLTPRAAKQVKKIRENEDLDDDLYLRVAVEGGGCSGLNYKLGFDYKNEDDKKVESEGVQIVIDPRHLMYLEGIFIDYPDGLDARGFTFDNPNASENCGCGASFAV